MWRSTPLLFLLFGQPAGAALPGCYQLRAMPEVASALELTADNRFRYMLSAGALDEHAEGRWRADGDNARLVTEPKPRPPDFTLMRTEKGEAPLTIVVAGPNGAGVPQVDVEIGFDSGEPVTGTTQSYGWTLPDDEKRTPRQIRFALPMFGFVGKPLPLPPGRGLLLQYRLDPNDLGVFAFEETLVVPTSDGVRLYRGDPPLDYLRTDCPKDEIRGR